MINLLFVVIFFITFASTAQNGLWSNLLLLFNVVMSGLIATNYAEPLTVWLVGQFPSYTNVLDFLAFWAVFSIAMVVLRGLTDVLSTVKVRFKKPVDMGVGIALSAWISWSVLCFAAMTLHTAPLDRSFLGGSFQTDPEEHMLFGFAPDRRWIAFARSMSLGGLSTSRTPDAANPSTVNEFDPRGEFILKYGERRYQLEDLLDVVVKPQ